MFQLPRPSLMHMHADAQAYYPDVTDSYLLPIGGVKLNLKNELLHWLLGSVSMAAGRLVFSVIQEPFRVLPFASWRAGIWQQAASCPLPSRDREHCTVACSQISSAFWRVFEHSSRRADVQ